MVVRIRRLLQSRCVVRDIRTAIDKFLSEPKITDSREVWLKAHKEQLQKFISNPDEYEIRSLILSSEEIPVMYLAKDKLPSPIIAFRQWSGRA